RILGRVPVRRWRQKPYFDRAPARTFKIRTLHVARDYHGGAVVLLGGGPKAGPEGQSFVDRGRRSDCDCRGRLGGRRRRALFPDRTGEAAASDRRPPFSDRSTKPIRTR